MSIEPAKGPKVPTNPINSRIADASLGTFDHGYSFAKQQTDGCVGSSLLWDHE